MNKKSNLALIWDFLKVRKKWWLFPIVLFMLLLSLLIVLTQGSAIAPMIYPSHYAPGTLGFLAPTEHPSEIVTKALLDAQLKLSVFEGKKTTIRPWLQDFDLLNVPYGESEVRGQIEAAEAIGVTSWMLWDAKNIYTPEAFLR